ncbi:unnamed protein product [Bursaphelenchus xylophilus]|uniref:(pine wood nematode) hypothetical protein n=1 Tax=Bursaphelenchus xylophilus TaxID=6326 RepID=A0A1I7RRS0_BURXY|nr:unnamed protein product [Bursaphelenchus xylophilus]CAG9123516.1 unnamed protein product [Bursaphelenchus xylophilus]
MRKSGTKRRREDEDGDAADAYPEDEDSRSRLTPVPVPKGREKDAEFSAPKTHKLTDLDEETQAQAPRDEDGPAVVDQTHYIIIPSYASWFDYNSIHDIEKRGVPDFFRNDNKSRTPEVYMTYRNFMIDTYRLNPFEYLSFTACRRNLCGDICSIARVHSFLEQWGLINYQVDAENRPAPVGPPATSHFMVLADAPNGVQPVNPFPHGFQLTDRAVKTEKVENREVDQNGEEEVREEGEEGSKIKVKVEKPKSGRLFEPGLKTDQYAKQLAAMKIKGAAPGRDWDDQETLLLLEALEMYKDDWNRVADHVGSRNQDECILRLLQLPIQDPFLEEGADDVLGPLAYQPIPFSQAGNPVMSTVAFLASVVEPRVAAAACKAALQEYTKMKDEIPPLLLEAHAKNVEAHAKANNGEIDPEIGLKQSGIAVEEKTDDTNKEDESMETDEKKDEEKSPESEVVKEARQLVSEKVQTAAASALAAAAVKAKHLANLEERRMKSLVAQLVETQMKKLELKLKHFDELEAITDKERESFEYQRQQLILERQYFHLDQLRYMQQRSKTDAYHALMQKGELEPGFEVRGCPPQMQPQLVPSQPGPTVAPGMTLPPRGDSANGAPSDSKPTEVAPAETAAPVGAPPAQAVPQQPTPPQPAPPGAPSDNLSQPQVSIAVPPSSGASSQPPPAQSYGYQPPYGNGPPPPPQGYPQGYHQPPPAGHYPPQQPPPPQQYYSQGAPPPGGPPRPYAPPPQQYNQRFGPGYDYNYQQGRPGGYPPSQGQYPYPQGYSSGQYYPQQGGQPPHPPPTQPGEGQEQPPPQ